MLALPISKSRFKALSFYQNNPKIKLFLQKNAKFSSAGGFAPDLRASDGWGLGPQTPKSAPSIANFWLRAWVRLPTITKKNLTFSIVCSGLVCWNRCNCYSTINYTRKNCANQFDVFENRRVARNSQWGGGLFRGSGGGAPSARKFCIFFAKITSL